VLRRSRDPPAVNTPPDAISEAPCGSIDNRGDIDTLLQNDYGLGAPHVGCDVAHFVDAASRAVQVGHRNGDPIYAATVAVNGEFDASMNLLLKILVPHDIARSNSDFHR
jgi:hypothetical protein